MRTRRKEVLNRREGSASKNDNRVSKPPSLRLDMHIKRTILKYKSRHGSGKVFDTDVPDLTEFLRRYHPQVTEEDTQRWIDRHSWIRVKKGRPPGSIGYSYGSSEIGSAVRVSRPRERNQTAAAPTDNASQTSQPRVESTAADDLRSADSQISDKNPMGSGASRPNFPNPRSMGQSNPSATLENQTPKQIVVNIAIPDDSTALENMLSLVNIMSNPTNSNSPTNDIFWNINGFTNDTSNPDEVHNVTPGESNAPNTRKEDQGQASSGDGHKLQNELQYARTLLRSIEQLHQMKVNFHSRPGLHRIWRRSLEPAHRSMIRKYTSIAVPANLEIPAEWLAQRIKSERKENDVVSLTGGK